MVCKHCGNSFEQRTGPGRKRIFCSDLCQRQWWKENGAEAHKKYVYICKHCHQEYETIHKDRNQYCSRKCAFKDIYNWHRGGRVRDADIIDRVCISCGKVYQDCPFLSDYCSVQCKERGAKLVCNVCEQIFYGRPNMLCCSDECRLQRKRDQYERYMTQKIGDRTYICQECGKQFIAPYGDKRRAFCSRKCGKRHAGRIHNMKRKAQKRGLPSENLDPLQVFERDGWRCGICKKHVNKSLEFPHPRSASLDHIIPLARGGPHTWENVQLAHLACNNRKRDSDGGQLRLSMLAGLT